MTLPASQQTIAPRFFHPTGVFSPLTREDLDRSIPELFARQVRAGPERPALRVAGRVIGYGELEADARRIARAIRARRPVGNEPVVVLDRAPALVVPAGLGVLMSGKILVMLDPNHPPARNAGVIEDAAPALVLTSDERAAAALGVEGARQLAIDRILAGPAGPDPGEPDAPGELAAIVYTSGTTGRPKGVIHGHSSLTHLIRELVNLLHLTPDDRLALLQPFTTIAGFRATWTPLLFGACLCPFDIAGEGLARLAAFLREERITFTHMVPTLFRHFAASLPADARFPALRAIRLGGESVSRRDFELYRERFASHAAFLVTYNASEVSTIAWLATDGDTVIEGDVMPVGYPREGTQVLLLDGDGRPVGPGEAGEIALRSRYMARGYWRRPDLTAERFRPDPEGGDERVYLSGDLGRFLPDGRLVQLGRTDTQVKVRGFRIEPAEVEGVLMDDPAVKEAAVVVRGDGHDGRLVAYLVPARPPGPSLPELRRRLRERLPAHMVPSAIVVLEAMPLTPGGKVARQALPAPPRERPALPEPFVAPRSPVEKALAAIWRDVLDLETIGIHDLFLDLGGTSLDATRITARAQDVFGADLSGAALLAAPTISQMALTVVDTLARDTPGVAERLLGEGPT